MTATVTLPTNLTAAYDALSAVERAKLDTLIGAAALEVPVVMLYRTAGDADNIKARAVWPKRVDVNKRTGVWYVGGDDSFRREYRNFSLPDILQVHEMEV